MVGSVGVDGFGMGHVARRAGGCGTTSTENFLNKLAVRGS